MSPSRIALFLCCAALVCAPPCRLLCGASARSSLSEWHGLSSALWSLLQPNVTVEDGGRAPLWLLLAWHSAASFNQADGSGGTEGAGIRFSPERSWPANAALAPSLDLLEDLRRRRLPNASFADVIALVGSLAVRAMHGPRVAFRPGRALLPPRPLPSDVPSRIPQGNSSLSSLLARFRSLSLDARELVALSGAHAVGRCHRQRSGYEGQWSARPMRFSNELFRNLLHQRWALRRWEGPVQFANEGGMGTLMMLPSDMALLDGNETRRWVETYAQNERLFFHDFAAAFGKLLSLGVAAHRTVGRIN